MNRSSKARWVYLLENEVIGNAAEGLVGPGFENEHDIARLHVWVAAACLSA